MRSMLSLICLAVPAVGYAAPTASEQARAIDPSHDAGLILPRADTLDEGTFAARALGVLGAHTLSYVPISDLQASLTAVTFIGLATEGDTLPLVLSVKYVALRTERVVLAVQGNLLSIVGERAQIGPALGLLADGYLDARGRLSVHGGLQTSALAYADEAVGSGIADGVGVFWTLGVAWRAHDALALVVDVDGAFVTDFDRLEGSDSPAIAAGVRVMGTHWGVDLGVLAADTNGWGALPLINVFWRS